MLHEFLIKYEKPILKMAMKRTIGLSEDLQSTDELEKGLPVFYKDLIDVLQKGPIDDGSEDPVHTEEITVGEAAAHGKESRRLGYTISQVVHGYGAICQAVTDFAQQKNELISPWEFHELNLCLDVVIAEAVTQYEKVGQEDIHHQEILRLGELAHELRNTLASAMLAHEMMVKGKVGNSGNTSRVLAKSLARMRELIDRSLAEVRLQSAPKPIFQRTQIMEVVSDVEATAMTEANSKGLNLIIQVDPTLEVNVDRQLLVSALSNLVQNAIKFTKQKGNIWLRTRTDLGKVVLEVEDECGGLPEGKAEILFKPFTQMGEDKSGLGLGLTISQRAIYLNDGTLFVKNLPKKGCIFSIILPRMPEDTDKLIH
jgi:signal transduction histidine kinase